MVFPPSHGDSPRKLSGRRPQGAERCAEIARVRNARDARVATTLFAVAVGGVLAAAGLESLGVLMVVIAAVQALAAGYAQVQLWRLRVRRLAELSTAA